MDIGSVTIVILAQTKTNAETKNNKQKGDIKMKTYKGFDKDLKCRDFQYEIGKKYEEKEAKACEKGFHACANPLNVLQYYPPCHENRYCEVEQDGDFSENGDDSKIASTKIEISNEISLEELIQAAMDKSGESEIYSINTGDHTVAENVESYSIALNKGYGSMAANAGNYSLATTVKGSSIAANTGNYSVAWSEKGYSIAANTGSCSAAVNNGHYSIAANMGERSVAISDSEGSVAINIGNHSTAINNVVESIALNMGRHAEASVIKEGSIAIATGIQSRAKGGLGSAIVLVERTTWNGYAHLLNNIKAAIVDGEKIKADTWYTLKNGEFVECD